MDIKNCVEFNVSKGDRVYTFHVPAGAPFGEIYDAAFEVLTQCVQFAQEAAQKAAPKELPNSQEQGN
jgi:hypothetical protein